MFILTVLETPVINWIPFGDFIPRFSLILKLKSGFIDPNPCCNDRQCRYDNIHLSTLLHCWDEKEGKQKEKEKAPTLVYQELWQYVFESHAIPPYS